ncbi:MAG: hypothetical protein M9931_01045, partial [Chitinophagales bacterium]|nr:hypothetical protein [Chitinophagales bacterium]
YSFNGQALTQSGIYYDTLVNANGCDSLITLNLLVSNFASTTINQSICQGQSYFFKGINLTQSGVYRDTLTASNGCDSIITLNLVVNNNSSSTLNQSICSGQSYNFNGQALTQSGIYYDTLVNAKGCDSLITLNLSVGGFISTNLNKSICQGNSYLFNNVSLTQSGVYKDTLTSSSGCDSIITLNLAVNNHSASTVNQSICSGQSYSFNGQTLTQQGIYFDTLTNANGCDSDNYIKSCSK